MYHEIHTCRVLYLYPFRTGWMNDWPVGVVQGLLEKLLDKHDGLSKDLIKNAIFYIVPNMNPDGKQPEPTNPPPGSCAPHRVAFTPPAHARMGLGATRQTLAYILTACMLLWPCDRSARQNVPFYKLCKLQHPPCPPTRSS